MATENSVCVSPLACPIIRLFIAFDFIIIIGVLSSFGSGHFFSKGLKTLEKKEEDTHKGELGERGIGRRWAGFWINWPLSSIDVPLASSLPPSLEEDRG